MSEYRNWWMDRGSRLSSLFVATCVFLGLCIALAEANRKYTGLITEVRGIFRSQEATRVRQFAQTKRDVIENLKVQRQNLAVLLDEHMVLKRMLQAILDRQEKPAR